jgi:hypothetical protein
VKPLTVYVERPRVVRVLNEKGHEGWMIVPPKHRGACLKECGCKRRKRK